MWKRLRYALSRLWRRSQSDPGERRVAKERARLRTVSDLGAAKIEEQRGTENPSHEHQVATPNRVLSIPDRLAGSGLLAWRCSDAG